MIARVVLVELAILVVSAAAIVLLKITNEVGCDINLISDCFIYIISHISK